ncbi:hypothetical protein CR513_44178, partial [Mucuna pruriens]
MEEGSHPNRLDEADSITITYIEGNENPRPKPLIIQYNSAPKPRVPFIIQNNNAVPWRYPIEETSTPPYNKRDCSSGNHQYSRNRGHDPKALRNKERVTAKKEKAIEAPKRVVIEEEAHEFLKMIRHSECEMLDQLHKTSMRISLLSLLINSESHRELLLKFLNDAHVPQDITPAKFGGIINITTSRHLSVFEVEVPAEGKGHNQPLHIVVKCGSYMIAKVSIDNGYSLNVLPKATLDKLHSLGTILKSNLVVVRDFDGSK